MCVKSHDNFIYRVMIISYTDITKKLFLIMGFSHSKFDAKKTLCTRQEKFILEKYDIYNFLLLIYQG